MAPIGIGLWRIWRRSPQLHHSSQSLFQLEQFFGGEARERAFTKARAIKSARNSSAPRLIYVVSGTTNTVGMPASVSRSA